MSVTPNSKLRAARTALRLSQDDLARSLRETGHRLGVPNDASKRLVQRWEAGVITSPRPAYARALESIFGLPVEQLGFTASVPMVRVSQDGRGGHDVRQFSVNPQAKNPAPAVVARVSAGTYSGVWISRYEYFSSGRDAMFTGLHYVVILQHGDRLTVRSLPGSSDSALTMDAEVDRNIVTGTWVEQTTEESYYRGARYHGAVQLLIEPTGHRMAGKWLGFGREFDVNTGPWELLLQDPSTTKKTLEKYNRRPDDYSPTRP